MQLLQFQAYQPILQYALKCGLTATAAFTGVGCMVGTGMPFMGTEIRLLKIARCSRGRL